MHRAIERADTYGIGAVVVTNGTHFGAAVYHAALALPHDMTGLALTTGGVQVAPVYGAKPMVGLNPLAIAVPADQELPFILDAAMNSVAGNKIWLAQHPAAGGGPAWQGRCSTGYGRFRME